MMNKLATTVVYQPTDASALAKTTCCASSASPISWIAMRGYSRRTKTKNLMRKTQNTLRNSPWALEVLIKVTKMACLKPSDST